MPNTTASRRIRRHRLLAATLSAALVGAPHVQAFERVVIGLEHFSDCASLMLSRPKQHAQECLPNRVPDDFSTLGSLSDSPVPASTLAPPPPPPPVVAAPAGCGPVDCGPPDCGPREL